MCHIRADIVQAINQMASFLAKARWNYWKALLYILGYVSRTLEMGTIYRGETCYAKGAVPIEYYKVDHNIEVYAG